MPPANYLVSGLPLSAVSHFCTFARGTAAFAPLHCLSLALPLNQDLLDYLAGFDPGELGVESLELEREGLGLDAELVQHGGMHGSSLQFMSLITTENATTPSLPSATTMTIILLWMTIWIIGLLHLRYWQLLWC